MSQVSYGTITIVDTTDIERIYMVYAKSVSNTMPPSDELTWSESIASAPGEGDFIWQKTVVEKAITEEKTYSDPVCVTGSSGQGVEKIINYYCNYGQGQPEEDYSGWQLEIPEYDSNKPNYWTKVVVIYSDDTREDFQASGTIATFENEKVGVFDSLEVSLLPIQDLHGYDRPWVGGAGKNLLHNEGENVTHNGITYTVNADGSVTANGTSTGNAQIILKRGFNLKAGTYTISGCPSSLSNAGNNYIRLYSSSTGFTISDYPTTKTDATKALTQDITDGMMWINIAPNTTVNDVTFYPQLELGSTATSYEPYSNICPISGHTEVVTHRTGVNVWDEEWTLGYWNYQNNGAFVPNSGFFACKNKIPVLPNTEYYWESPSVVREMLFYDSDENYISRLPLAGTVTSLVVTTPSNCHYVTFYFGGVYGNTYKNDISINYPSTDTEYHAYDGTTYTTALGQTVYGGTLDVVSGVLTVDRAMVDLGSLNWSKQNTSTGHWRFLASFSDVMPAERESSVTELYCTIYASISPSATWIGETGVANNNSSPVFIVCDETYLNASDFKTAMNGVKLAYPLATPQTYQLTPTQIDSLLGRNNVWSDGAVEVEGHTISKRDVMIYKDNGLTDVVNKSAEANTNAAEALEKANDGIVYTTQLWYQTNSTGALSVPASHSQVDQGTITYNNWRSVRPSNNVDSYKYYYYCYEYLHGDGTYTYSAEAILDTSNLSQYQIGALTTKVKNFWWDSNGAHIASGKNGNEVTTNTISTYGYHALMGLTGISFNYDSAKVVDLNGTTPSLDFYQPPIISGSTVTQGKKTMMLSANALRFYNPSDGTTEQAVLDVNGLTLKEGGIESGNSGNGYVYLSTKNYGITHNNQTITINNHEATNWRQIIGSKFGVDSEGNLYASSAHISGPIRVTAGTNVYTTDNTNPLEIGGRNLLLDSKSMESWSYGTDASLNSVDDFGEAVLVPIENNTWNAIISTRPTLNSSILNGNSMILSFEYTLSEDCTIAIGVDGTNEEPNTSSSITKTKYITKYYNLNTATAWNKFSAIMPTTIEELTLGSGEVNSFSISIANYLKANTIMKIRKVQLEYGNTATDWSPSPEDMSEDIVLAIQTLKDDTKSELATIQSEFDITADNIASQVSKKVGYDEIISVINQTAEEIKIEANKIDIEALTEQMTFSASNIVFGNTNVADSLNELNAAVSIDTETSTIYVGDRQGFHVRIDGSQLGFYQAGESDPVAYINNNQLYITQSVVLQQMDVGTSKLNNGDGQWSWKIHKNVNGENNLYLKWMG